MRSGSRLKNLKSSSIERIKKGENFSPFYKLQTLRFQLQINRWSQDSLKES